MSIAICFNTQSLCSRVHNNTHLHNYREYMYIHCKVKPAHAHTIPRALTLDEKIALGLGALSNRLTLNTTGISDTEGIL